MRWCSTVITSIVVLITGSSCSKGGDSRTLSVGTSIYEGGGTSTDASPVTPPAATATATSTSTNTSTSTSTGLVGGQDGGQATALTGESLEQCQAKNQAWEAVVNSGNSPSDCVNTLEAFCCTRQEVNARFPTESATLESQYFTTYIDQQNLTLYACSFDTSGKHFLHFAKIVSGTVTYKTAFFSGITEVETGDPTTGCPAVTTASLNKPSLLLNDETEAPANPEYPAMPAE